MFLPLEYIKYRWNAKGRHGIHSPFVYDFVDNCLRIKLKAEDTSILNNLFGRLKNSRQEIEIQDFGAGSKKLGSKRKVSAIFKMSSSKGKYGKLLYRLSKHYQPKEILEFGTSLGVGSTYLALGSNNSTITTVEACKNTRTVALENLKDLDSIESKLGTFVDYLAELPKEKQFDMIFIDGHHDGEALIQYLNQLQKHAHDETLFILDDIRWSDSMKAAWEEISNDSRFHMSMELFRVGIVSRRSHMEKEKFVIRY
ncbi:MAG: class I SAM-dependent methyltransferase [Crocinitomicaceae bacterium]|nr:class I SAM-dependent methyltransferase [Flavobacteriales bacterium]NQZ35164.1 class I SAM-dependent methyltransferase [Crocinitomicaceae bacterium]